ncbi:hypothetical protein B0H17DRAFT_1212075 [Mycena rosella]|uniref:Uncharacterized protein n=1 Tax=Mycena rosella TaxID=1033263 RepID=A0AAD7G6Q1_MYCRO|nr:hypothetical protein B0H17DRAFT_1212075 [Mycena rosella]
MVLFPLLSESQFHRRANFHKAAHSTSAGKNAESLPPKTTARLALFRDIATALATDHRFNLTGLKSNTSAATLFTFCVLAPEVTQGPSYWDDDELGGLHLDRDEAGTIYLSEKSDLPYQGLTKPERLVRANKLGGAAYQLSSGPSVLLGDSISEGLIMWGAMGIDTSADHTTTAAARSPRTGAWLRLMRERGWGPRPGSGGASTNTSGTAYDASTTATVSVAAQTYEVAFTGYVGWTSALLVRVSTYLMYL